MSVAVRAALVVFVLGALGVWLVKPIGDACSDLAKLPAGSTGSSSPSFAPPLTRTCTYTTADVTRTTKRYVPVVDWLVLAVVAGVVGAGVGLLGPGTPRPQREPKPERAPRPERTPRALRTPRAAKQQRTRSAAAAPAPEPAPAPPPQTAEDRAAEREREREERARRRGRR